eukprot:5787779-Pleurochrysis_carterae.AAC.2
MISVYGRVRKLAQLILASAEAPLERPKSSLSASSLPGKRLFTITIEPARSSAPAIPRPTMPTPPTTHVTEPSSEGTFAAAIEMVDSVSSPVDSRSRPGVDETWEKRRSKLI